MAFLLTSPTSSARRSPSPGCAGQLRGGGAPKGTGRPTGRRSTFFAILFFPFAILGIEVRERGDSGFPDIGKRQKIKKSKRNARASIDKCHRHLCVGLLFSVCCTFRIFMVRTHSRFPIIFFKPQYIYLRRLWPRAVADDGLPVGESDVAHLGGESTA